MLNPAPRERQLLCNMDAVARARAASAQRSLRLGPLDQSLHRLMRRNIHCEPAAVGLRYQNTNAAMKMAPNTNRAIRSYRSFPSCLRRILPGIRWRLTSGVYRTKQANRQLWAGVFSARSQPGAIETGCRVPSGVSFEATRSRRGGSVGWSGERHPHLTFDAQQTHSMKPVR